MAKKTVLKALLTSGFAPLSNEVKSLLKDETESGEAVLPDLGEVAMPDYSVVESTGEVIEAAESADEAPKPADTEKKPKARQKAKEPAENANDDAVSSFFGETE